MSIVSGGTFYIDNQWTGITVPGGGSKQPLYYSAVSIAQGSNGNESPGALSLATVTSGGAIWVGSRAQLNTCDFQSGSTLIVSAFGVLSSNIIGSGATMICSGKWIYAADNTFSPGASVVLNNDVVWDGGSNGSITDETIFTVNSGATLQNVVVDSGGSSLIQSGGVLSGGTINSGGSVHVTSGAQISGAVSVVDGAHLDIYADAGGSVDLQGNTNIGLVISGLSQGGALSTVISGFNGNSPGDSDGVEIDGLSQSDIVSVSFKDGDNISLLTKSGNTINLNIVGIEESGYALGTAASGALLVETCYLSGTKINTPNGMMDITELREGDDVLVFSPPSQEFRCEKISAIYSGYCNIRNHLPDDLAGWPIRILKNAIKENVPYKDMLITSEHCLFFEGAFVPARMLVNGVSIYFDKKINSYSYYHIELENHSVIMADGVLSESYLDTGNVNVFSNNRKIIPFFRSKNLSWNLDSCAPLRTDIGFVKTIYDDIRERHHALGLSASNKKQKITYDPDIKILINDIHKVSPVRIQNGKAVFLIPERTKFVRIISRYARPCDIEGYFVDDRRYLGLLIGDIRLFTSLSTHLCNQHLINSDLEGWHAIETQEKRWTNGSAFLPIDTHGLEAISVLVITVEQAGPYLSDQTNEYNIAENTNELFGIKCKA